MRLGVVTVESTVVASESAKAAEASAPKGQSSIFFVVTPSLEQVVEAACKLDDVSGINDGISFSVGSLAHFLIHVKTSEYETTNYSLDFGGLAPVTL